MSVKHKLANGNTPQEIPPTQSLCQKAQAKTQGGQIKIWSANKKTFIILFYNFLFDVVQVLFEHTGTKLIAYTFIQFYE